MVCSAGSATSDDFDARPITVTFTAKKKTPKFTLSIVDDEECEGEETLVCEVRASSYNRNRRPGRTRRVTVTIIDSSEDEADCNPGKQHWCRIVYRGTFQYILMAHATLSCLTLSKL